MSSYAPACIKLLAQYKSLMKLVSEEIGSLEAFMKRFKVSSRLYWMNAESWVDLRAARSAHGSATVQLSRRKP